MLSKLNCDRRGVCALAHLIARESNPDPDTNTLDTDASDQMSEEIWGWSVTLPKEVDPDLGGWPEERADLELSCLIRPRWRSGYVVG